MKDVNFNRYGSGDKLSWPWGCNWCKSTVCGKAQNGKEKVLKRAFNKWVRRQGKKIINNELNGV